MSAGRRVRIVLRLPGGRSALSLFVAGSIAVHVILALVLILLPLGRRRASAVNDSMVVELAGPMPGPPSPAVGALAPPAPPVPPVEAPREVPKPEPKGPSLVEPKEKKEKEKKKKPESEQFAAAKPPRVPAPPPSAGVPGGTPAPGAGGVVGGGGSGALDPGSSELAWYWASVTAALRSHWVRPVLEGAGGVLTVTITFEVRRDGTVANATVETGSGVPSLDRSALRAVADASPLPPLPSSSKEASLSARYQFDLTPGE